MPLQRYDKHAILEACLPVFARHGYDNTSTAMLAEAAGVSKALLFHHFGSKKELYLALLDHCMAPAKAHLKLTSLLAYDDFFVARERLSVIKYEFSKQNPAAYRVLREAYLTTPADLKAEIEKRYDVMMVERSSFWEQLFEKVPLKPGVDRRQAFELVTLVLDYFDQKFLVDTAVGEKLDDAYVYRFLAERSSFLAMIRFGVEEQKDGDDG